MLVLACWEQPAERGLRFQQVIDEIYLYSSEGERITRIASDFVGAAELRGRRSQPNFFVTLTGFTNPGIVGQYNLAELDDSKKWSIYRSTKVKGLQAEEFSAEQVWYKGKDGTRVPMFIVRHKSTKRDGTAPAVQYGKSIFQVQICHATGNIIYAII